MKNANSGTTDEVEHNEQMDSFGDVDDDEAELGPGTTVFVKNLNFNTTEEALKEKFSSKFKIRSATISKKRGRFSFSCLFLSF